MNLRSKLIRLAHENPDLRSHLLPLIRKKEAMNFTTMYALHHYLKEHPGADRSRHHVERKPYNPDDEPLYRHPNKEIRENWREVTEQRRKEKKEKEEKEKEEKEEKEKNSLKTKFKNFFKKDQKEQGLKIVTGQKLTSSLIRLAHANPEMRPHLLPLIKKAEMFNTEEALKKYLKDHPNADKSNHSVKKHEEKEPSKSKEPKGETVDIKELPDDATVKDLPPEAREEISEYKLSIVGDSAKQAISIARKIKKGIEDAADICKMSPSVCKGNKGLTRDKMPQIEGEKSVKAMLASKKPSDVAKGKAMVQAGADPDSDKSIMAQMADFLADNGVKTTKKKMPVGKMKATQSEILTEKVYGMADSYLKGKFDNIDDSVIVSKDGHILDGHHRWAALLTLDAGREMNVREIDMTMDELLAEAASFPGVYKADFKGNPLPEDDQKKYKSDNKSKYKKKSFSLYGSVVRLAYTRPEFRARLLPVIQEVRR